MKKKFKEKGYNIEKFLNSDTRRIDSNGTIYKYYAAKNGVIKKKFVNTKHAKEWIEFQTGPPLDMSF